MTYNRARTARPATVTEAIVPAVLTAPGLGRHADWVVTELYSLHYRALVRLAVLLVRLEESAVVAALRRLPGRQREAIVLRYYADFSEAETAAAMGISCGAVKSHTARAIAALRADLEQQAGAGSSPGTT